MTPQEQRTPLTVGTWIAGILERWPLVLKVVLGAVLLAGIAAVAIPPVYRTKVSFVANSTSSSKLGSALGSGALSSLAGSIGMPAVGDPSESPAFYSDLIESEELRRRLVTSKFPDPRTENPNDSAVLVDIMKIKSKDPARRVEIAMKQMSKSTKVFFDTKTNLVRIEVDARWSELAAEIAGRTIQLVDQFNKEQRSTRSNAKREFLQSRLDSAKIQLAAAEDRQKYFYEQNRGCCRNSPELQAMELKLKRETDIASNLYMTLQQQFEAARLDAINDAALITVVDRPFPSRKAVWPRYWLLLASSLAVGTILGLLIAGCAVIMADWRVRNPTTANQLSDSLSHIPFPVGRRRRRVAESG
jgi:uncharacterized protein involved in exopolysaccharide biosynthesis